MICSMKIFIQILSKEGCKGTEEAVENRNYLSKRMTDEITEVQRILEETNRVDTAGLKMGGVQQGGQNQMISLAEMTFHELIKKINREEAGIGKFI
jgi:hypothetical protein